MKFGKLANAIKTSKLLHHYTGSTPKNNINANSKSWQPFVQKLFSGKNLLISNTVICCLMSGVGDLVLQSYEKLKSRRRNIDQRRTCHLALSGLTVGPACHFWYHILEKYLPGRTISIVLKKVFVDQIIFSPICLALFFVTLGVLDDSSFMDICREIYYKGKIIYTAEWCVWPPAQLVNFYFISLRFRVLFDNIVSFGFDIFQSHVRYKPL